MTNRERSSASKKRKRRGFLIMPFDPGLDWLRDEIVTAGNSEAVAVERADNIFEPGVVVDQILEAIDQADVIIGVCTGRNANVFFELGHAWRNHTPVLLAESKADLPFDVAHYRAVMYGRPLRQSDLRRRLAMTIKGALQERTLPALRHEVW